MKKGESDLNTNAQLEAVPKEFTEDAELMFTVSDTGIGIPQEHWKHVFTAFSQVDSSTTRKYGGSGEENKISGVIY